ncbi:hypothetical protein AB0K05_15000 [Nonomuraea sp. NPDC049486]|uniref:hypothetical protein n=1 Tax=Nonomuraea sp. NPDC049486 TaxID=3155773 RepID=UPI0034185ED3
MRTPGVTERDGSHTHCNGRLARAGCPALEDLVERYQNAGGTFLICSICFNAKALDEARLIKSAELGGTVPMWRWIGDGRKGALTKNSYMLFMDQVRNLQQRAHP